MGWNFYVTLIWTLKGCVLCFYNRITYVHGKQPAMGKVHSDLRTRLGLRQQVFVKWTAVACGFAYAGVLGAIWGHCTPVHKNWQVVPYPGGKRPLV